MLRWEKKAEKMILLDISRIEWDNMGLDYYIKPNELYTFSFVLFINNKLNTWHLRNILEFSFLYIDHFLSSKEIGPIYTYSYSFSY